MTWIKYFSLNFFSKAQKNFHFQHSVLLSLAMALNEIDQLIKSFNFAVEQDIEWRSSWNRLNASWSEEYDNALQTINEQKNTIQKLAKQLDDAALISSQAEEANKLLYKDVCFLSKEFESLLH